MSDLAAGRCVPELKLEWTEAQWLECLLCAYDPGFSSHHAPWQRQSFSTDCLSLVQKSRTKQKE